MGMGCYQGRCVLLFDFHLHILTLGNFIFEDLVEYCYNEQFSASCAPGMTVHVVAAFYGRMQLGRCVSADYGYLGCQADVTHIMNRLCSGKQSCNISIAADELGVNNTCASDLNEYLAANYTCQPAGSNSWEGNYSQTCL